MENISYCVLLIESFFSELKIGPKKFHSESSVHVTEEVPRQSSSFRLITIKAWSSLLVNGKKKQLESISVTSIHRTQNAMLKPTAGSDMSRWHNFVYKKILKNLHRRLVEFKQVQPDCRIQNQYLKQQHCLYGEWKLRLRGCEIKIRLQSIKLLN